MGWFARLIDWFRKKFWGKDLELSVVGLQHAGKTTLINVIATGQYDKDTIPTIGFNLRQIEKGRVSMKVWDLGGQPRFRDSWEKYCRGVDAIVYVVDSAEFGNIDVARTQLHQLLSWPSLVGIPVLVLANKNDLPGALNQEQMIEQMQLTTIAHRKVACYSISAKNVVNIDITLKWLSSLPKGKKKKK